jgi:phosphoribosyl-ATP pyrophosphohydrolase/phosphoribosyl-AMP cyclohydrolase
MIETMNFEKGGGLIPAIVQNAESGEVLMLGFMNRAALEETERSGEVVFWSRSRSERWRKGETSGNVLKVVSIHPDCDRDAILIQAHPTGPVCHTGDPTCFPSCGSSFDSVLERLARVIALRKKEMPEDSYTAKLFREGSARIAQKVGEEAVEVVIASQTQESQRLIEETADLLYHLLVLLAEKEVAVADIAAELGRRAR